MKRINKFFFINGLIGSLIFYYFVRKIQTYYEVDISIDGYGLAGAVWYGAGLGFVFGVKFIRIQEIIDYFRKWLKNFMSKIFVVYGHHNINKSFNQEIRDTFCSEAKKLGHEIDLINLHEEKPIPFYDGSEPSE